MNFFRKLAVEFLKAATAAGSGSPVNLDVALRTIARLLDQAPNLDDIAELKTKIAELEAESDLRGPADAKWLLED